MPKYRIYARHTVPDGDKVTGQIGGLVVANVRAGFWHPVVKTWKRNTTNEHTHRYGQSYVPSYLLPQRAYLRTRKTSQVLVCRGPSIWHTLLITPSNVVGSFIFPQAPAQMYTVKRMRVRRTVSCWGIKVPYDDHSRFADSREFYCPLKGWWSRCRWGLRCRSPRVLVT